MEHRDRSESRHGHRSLPQGEVGEISRNTALLLSGLWQTMWLSAAAWFLLRGSASPGSMRKEVPQGSRSLPQISVEILILWVTSELEANLEPPYLSPLSNCFGPRLSCNGVC